MIDQNEALRFECIKLALQTSNNSIASGNGAVDIIEIAAKYFEFIKKSI